MKKIALALLCLSVLVAAPACGRRKDETKKVKKVKKSKKVKKANGKKKVNGVKKGY